MRKFFCIGLLLLSISVFSQGEAKTEIQWLNIEKAEKLAAKYNSDMLVFFFRNGCPECKKMKAETLQNPEIIKLINENFFPVMLNARTKDTIVYNGKEYINQQPAEHGNNFRHDLYHELANAIKGRYYYPYIVIIDGQHNKVSKMPGFFPAARLKRSLQQALK
ncbi:MAG: thioredoxin fold domain-containing protein [Flavobacteriales bacterium]|nr:thioredoxin fold domain-containing protein [Flavobacteriales bacterium]